jgi:hypothetical protein
MTTVEAMCCSASVAGSSRGSRSWVCFPNVTDGVAFGINYPIRDDPD